MGQTGDPYASAVTKSVSPPAEFLAWIEELQNSGDYHWASDTLEGIYTTVENSGRVTRRQEEAVRNIEESQSKR